RAAGGGAARRDLRPAAAPGGRRHRPPGAGQPHQGPGRPVEDHHLRSLDGPGDRLERQGGGGGGFGYDEQSGVGDRHHRRHVGDPGHRRRRRDRDRQRPSGPEGDPQGGRRARQGVSRQGGGGGQLGLQPPPAAGRDLLQGQGPARRRGPGPAGQHVGAGRDRNRVAPRRPGGADPGRGGARTHGFIGKGERQEGG